MYFYIIQLFDSSYKEDIILGLTSAGIMQGTYIEGENYDNILSNQFPLFTGFFKTKENKEIISSLFFGMVDDKKTIKNFEKVIHESGMDNEENKIYQIIVLKGE